MRFHDIYILINERKKKKERERNDGTLISFRQSFSVIRAGFSCYLLLYRLFAMLRIQWFLCAPFFPLIIKLFSSFVYQENIRNLVEREMAVSFVHINEKDNQFASKFCNCFTSSTYASFWYHTYIT